MYKAELHCLLFTFFMSQACHILLFSPSLNAFAIPVNMLWSASCLVPAWKPGLHSCLGLWKLQQDWGPGQGTQQLPPIPDVCISFQHRPSITFEGWQPFSTQNISLVIPISRSPPVQTHWLLHKFCTTVTPPQCHLYDLLRNTSIPTTGFSYPHHEALVLLQRALHKCKQMNSSQQPYPEIIKSPTVILLCFSRLPHLPVLRISAHTQHPSLCSSARQVSTREDLAPGIHCCSAQQCLLKERAHMYSLLRHRPQRSPQPLFSISCWTLILCLPQSLFFFQHGQKSQPHSCML